jgi:hypothetical protein
VGQAVSVLLDAHEDGRSDAEYDGFEDRPKRVSTVYSAYDQNHSVYQKAYPDQMGHLTYKRAQRRKHGDNLLQVRPRKVIRST